MGDIAKFNGRYKLLNSENFDNYMRALNVGFALRTLGNTLKPSVEIIVSDDKVTLKTHSTFKNTEQTFKLNEETDEETMDGRKVKTTFSFEGGKLIQRQKATKAEEKNSDITRELVGEKELVVTLLVHDPKEPVTAKRFYERE